MIKVEELSYSFPEKDLYKKISFTIEDGVHAVLIGSNGTGKTTLVDLILNTDEYLFTGNVKKDSMDRVGYVSQFVKHEKDCDLNVYDYLCQDFLAMLKQQEEICIEMETAEDFDEIMDRYQKALDEFQAVDGDNYDTNIHKQLKLAGLKNLEDISVAAISGGEFKLVEIIRNMLRHPGFLVMDEPDVFLDFENINGLRELINSYKGTMLVITHNRYLLNHCFNKVLHLENADIQEFEGNYIDYNYALLQTKIEMQEAAAKDLEEIARQQQVVNRMRASATAIDNPAKGRQLKARVSLLERLKERAIKAPFVEVRQPEIRFGNPAELTDMSSQEETQAQTPMPEDSHISGQEEKSDQTETQVLTDIPDQPENILFLEDYEIIFDDVLLKDVNLNIGPHDKVAIVGPNGTGKTTLLRNIYKNYSECLSEGGQPDGRITFAPNVRVGFLSQVYDDVLKDDINIYKTFESLGLETEREVREYLEGYCFPEDLLDHLVGQLSGGEKNLLQLAMLGLSDANLLLLDEPTSHLDTYSQIALEKAVRNYNGAILMVSHDFYTIANCVQYVYYIENRTIRKMSGRAFRKMIYKNHFPKDYLELEKRKKELETKIQALLIENNFEKARNVCEQLEPIIHKMRG